MRQGEKPIVTADFDFRNPGQVTYTRTRGDESKEQGDMEIPLDTIIYPLGMRWFTGRTLKALGEGERHVFTAKVTSIDDEDLFSPQFDLRSARLSPELEDLTLEVNNKVYMTRKYIVNGGPYRESPFWVEEASDTMVRYHFELPNGEAWLVELDER